MTRNINQEDTLKCLKLFRTTKDQEALTILVMSNQGLVRKIASKYLNQSLEFDDLCQIGNEGLIDAINKFDFNEYPMKAFSTYTGTAIERKIIRALYSNNKHNDVLSFEDPVFKNKDDDELTLENMLGTDSELVYEDVVDSIKSDVIRNAISCLTAIEKKIIILRYGLNDDYIRTQEEIGEELNLSKERIRQIENKALIKLRHPRNTRKLIEFIER